MYPGIMFGLALLAAAPDTKDPPPKDPPSILGEWAFEKVTRGARETPVPGKQSFTFAAGGGLTIKDAGRGQTEEGSYKVDATKRPAEIDFVPPKETGAMRGLFQIEGDTLTLCFGPSRDAARPTKVASPEGSETVLWTFKRIKK